MTDNNQSFTITQSNFETEVINNDLTVLVDFWAPWCGPCRVMNPIIESLSAKFAGKVKVGKANIDDHADLATQYEIQAVPTILIFQNGEVVATFPGLVTELAVAEKLTSLTTENENFANKNKSQAA